VVLWRQSATQYLLYNITSLVISSLSLVKYWVYSHFHHNSQSFLVFITVNHLNNIRVIKMWHDLQFLHEFFFHQWIVISQELGSVLVTRVLVNYSPHNSMGTPAIITLHVTRTGYHRNLAIIRSHVRRISNHGTPIIISSHVTREPCNHYITCSTHWSPWEPNNHNTNGWQYNSFNCIHSNQYDDLRHYFIQIHASCLYDTATLSGPPGLQWTL